jgi:hypothetical protein
MQQLQAAQQEFSGSPFLRMHVFQAKPTCMLACLFSMLIVLPSMADSTHFAAACSALAEGQLKKEDPRLMNDSRLLEACIPTMQGRLAKRRHGH